MSQFFFEFILFAICALSAVMRSEKKRHTQHYWTTFMLPALCDFCDIILLNFGLTQISPSVATLLRTLMSPVSALLAYVLLNARFSWSQISAMTLIINGIILGCIVQM